MCVSVCAMRRYKLDTGFYVFVYTATGTNVAHGANPRCECNMWQL